MQIIAAADESPMEKEAKLKMLEAYNVTLDERLRRKRLYLEKRFYDVKFQSVIEKSRSVTQRAIFDILK